SARSWRPRCARSAARCLGRSLEPSSAALRRQTKGRPCGRPPVYALRVSSLPVIVVWGVVVVVVRAIVVVARRRGVVVARAAQVEAEAERVSQRRRRHGTRDG